MVLRAQKRKEIFYGTIHHPPAILPLFERTPKYYILLLRNTQATMVSSSIDINSATQAGPKSGTEWIVTSSSTFSILGKESTSSQTTTKIDHPIFSYRSPATSLRGLVVTTDEPICSLHIVLSTESNGGGSTTAAATTTTTTSNDSGGKGIVVAQETSSSSEAWHHPDDGLPHTLEHLVFLGSQTHPHKGVLDKLANRSMADGTNAWTATDHTAYTLSTAGSEGVMNLMPIFADHVLFPTLTDSGTFASLFLIYCNNLLACFVYAFFL